MIKTKCWLICVIVICCGNIKAQQKPHYTQYILNQYIINPAISGIENYTDVKLSHRHQWAGLQDAPVTSYFTLHSPIGKSDFRTTPTSFQIEGENPRGKRYWDAYTAPTPHHGLGVQVINDVTGPLRNFSAYGTYAYHLGLTNTISLAAGFGIGLNRISLDADKLDFGDVIVDPAVYSSGILHKTKFDLTAGFYLYSGDFFVGLSAQQIVPQKIDFSGSTGSPSTVSIREGKSVPHLFGTAGYRFLIGEDFNLIPSLMVKYVNPVPTQIEGNLKLQYRDLLWLGTSYRHKDGFAGMAGINVSNIFNVGYAYDYTTSRLNNFTKGTHEVILGFIIGNNYPDRCPKVLW